MPLLARELVAATRTTTLVSVAPQLAQDDAGTLVAALSPFIHLRLDSIADIASRVGYESQISFTRAFSRIVGTTPGAFRRGARHPESTARE